MILCSKHGARPHIADRRLHRFGTSARVGAAAFGERQQRVSPKPQRRDLRRRGTERIELAERGPRLVGPAESDQRHRPLQMPVARGGNIVGRRIDFVQQRERFGRALFLQALGDEVQPRGGIVRVARQRLAQQRLGHLVAAGEPQQRRKIARRRAMAGLRLQGAGHRDLGIVDRPLRIAREAEIDPGVGEARAQLHRDGKGLFGARRLAGGHPGLAVSVMRLGGIWGGKAGVPRCFQSRLRVAALQRAAEITHSRQRIVCEAACGRNRWRLGHLGPHAARFPLLPVIKVPPRVRVNGVRVNGIWVNGVQTHLRLRGARTKLRMRHFTCYACARPPPSSAAGSNSVTQAPLRPERMVAIF